MSFCIVPCAIRYAHELRVTEHHEPSRSSYIYRASLSVCLRPLSAWAQRLGASSANLHEQAVVDAARARDAAVDFALDTHRRVGSRISKLTPAACSAFFYRRRINHDELSAQSNPVQSGVNRSPIQGSCSIAIEPHNHRSPRNSCPSGRMVVGWRREEKMIRPRTRTHQRGYRNT